MKTILLIDDDEMCRSPVAEMLRGSGWRVLEAMDGEVGLLLAFQHRPDVILCDLLMPRVNGYQVCRGVREHSELRHTRIIVLTGRDYAADRKSAEEAGADDYLVKPIDFTKLRAALDRSVFSAAAAHYADDSPMLWLPGEGEARVKFWGVRGSIPTPGPETVGFGGNTSCVEIRADGQHIICDAGSGIRPLGAALVAEAAGRPINLTVLITHTHWDHIQGFPFFVPAYDSRNKLHIRGYEGASDGLRATLAGQMESPYFPVALDQMPGNLEIQELKTMQFSVGAIKVKACFTNHPGVCVGYRFETSSGSIVYMPDNETQAVENGTQFVSGSGAGEDQIVEFLRDADVVMLDAQYTAEEYRAHVGWGHGCIDEVVALAVRANVKRLFTFHHDPAHDDEFLTNMLTHARELAFAAGSALHIDAAREGQQVVLRAEAALLAKAS